MGAPTAVHTASIYHHNTGAAEYHTRQHCCYTLEQRERGRCSFAGHTTITMSAQVEHVGELPRSHEVEETATPSVIVEPSEREPKQKEEESKLLKQKEEQKTTAGTAAAAVAVAAESQSPVQKSSERETEDDGFLYLDMEASEVKAGEAGSGLGEEGEVNEKWIYPSQRNCCTRSAVCVSVMYECNTRFNRRLNLGIEMQ